MLGDGTALEFGTHLNADFTTSTNIKTLLMVLLNIAKIDLMPIQYFHSKLINHIIKIQKNM